MEKQRIVILDGGIDTGKMGPEAFCCAGFFTYYR